MKAQNVFYIHEFQEPNNGLYCDQICTNSMAAYSCSCTNGYVLTNNRTCQAINSPPSEGHSLLFANAIDVRHVHLDSSKDQQVASIKVIETKETLALDFLHRNRSVCWISHNNSYAQMQCVHIENMSIEKSWNMPMPDMYSFKNVHQIAVDWASNNWYFLDDTLNVILLCSLKPNKFLCKMILSAHLSQPRGIALDPNEGLMFFTVWGSDSAKLERASLDGSQRRVLVDTKIVYPYGITLDLPLKRVYWVDTYLDYIEAVDYDGRNRKTILRGSPVQNLYSASVFENSLYLTSWRNNSILRVNKFKPSEHITTVLDGLERPFAIQVFHRQRQPLKDEHHPCQASPCQHVSF